MLPLDSTQLGSVEVMVSETMIILITGHQVASNRHITCRSSNKLMVIALQNSSPLLISPCLCKYIYQLHAFTIFISNYGCGLGAGKSEGIGPAGVYNPKTGDFE